MPDTTTIVSILALVVSIASAALAWWTSRHQNALQMRLYDLESARERDRVRATRIARVTATIDRPDRGTWVLLLENDGAATARNVRVTIDGTPLLKHRLVPRGLQEVTVMGPGTTTQYLLAPTMGMVSVLTVRIEWEDDSGEAGGWESQLNL